MTLVPANTAAETDALFPAHLIDPMIDLAERLSGTDFVPKAFRNNPPAVLAVILTGREVGIGPMQALASIDSIEGKPTKSPELMRALVQRAGHRFTVVELSNSKVTVEGQRRGEAEVLAMTWTLEDARRAGLANKQTWQRYPRAMLLARVTGELCRAVFADVIGGYSLTPEEAADIDATPLPIGAPSADEAPGPSTPPQAGGRRPRRPSTPTPPAPDLPGDEPADAEVIDETPAEADDLERPFTEEG